MKIEVRRRDMIKPSSPTPESLRTYNFSLANQLSVNVKVPYVLFYDSPGNYNAAIDELKKSLSETLSLMYLLAGRVKEDRLAIECNDEGVEFIEADVAENMSSFLENPDIEMIRKLVSINSFTGLYEPNSDGKVLVIQVNRFICGGMSIGLIISHAIGDGTSIHTFVDTWAKINRGCRHAVNDGGFIFDSSKIFPPVTNTAATEEQLAKIAKGSGEDQEKYVFRRFYIPATAVAQLREQVRLAINYRPTRFEALTAFIWDAVIAANQERHQGRINLHILTTIINLRSRMEPPFPPNCLGCNTYGVTGHWDQTKEGPPSRHTLALKVRDSIRAVNDGAVRQRYSKEGYLQSLERKDDETIRNEGDKKNMYCLYTISLLGMQFYEADLGWGKPRWVVDALVLNDSVLFHETKFGEGVEMWMGLPEELMNILLQNQQFRSCVSDAFP